MVKLVKVVLKNTPSPLLSQTEPPHGLYLFSDGSRVGQLSLSSGKIRRKFPTLSSIQDRIALTATSPSGSFVGGLLLEGDLFIWDKWRDLLLTFVTPLSRIGTEKMPTLKGKLVEKANL